MEKILTFDCYGTLLDTSPLYTLIEEIADFHKLPKNKAIETFIRYEDRLMYGEQFLPYDKLLFEILTYCDMELGTNVFTSNYEKVIETHKNFIPFPDVLPALHKLKEKGYELAIMSNSTKQIMNWHLNTLDNVFDHSLVAEETKCYKSVLSFFKIAEETFKLHNKEHCHIAKGYWWDIVPAKKMNWNKIWMNRDNLMNGRKNELPYLIISSLSELPQLNSKSDIDEW